MPLLLLKAFLLKALAFAKRLNLSQIALVVAIGFALVFRVQLGLERRHSAKVEARVNELRAERDSLIHAQHIAADKNRAEVERIKNEQGAITNEVERNLNSRLERLRRELRANASGGSPASGAQTSPDGSPAQGTDGAAGVCLTPERLLRAAENEERHDQLITWVERQLGVKR